MDPRKDLDRRVGVDVARADGDGDDDVERDRQGARYERQMYGPGMEEGQTGCRPGERTAKEETAWKSRSCGGGGKAEEEVEEKRERHRGNLLCFERYGGGPRNT